MTDTFIEMTEDEFDARFPLVRNHLNPNASWSYGAGDGEGCLFETYGEEFAFVKQQDLDCVWTLVDGDDGDMYVISGLHFVNRVGYFISQVAVPAGTTIEIHIPMQRVHE